MLDKCLATARALVRAGSTRRVIFLISHMRANTSLVAHILGSHPAIEGYYEMHMTYFSARSLLKWKQKFYEFDKPKSSAQIVFDKLLHNRYRIIKSFQDSLSCYFLVSLRRPEETISSIVELYRGRNDRRSTVTGASEYYLNRLNGIRAFVTENPGTFFYYDAKALTRTSIVLLNAMTEYLDLSVALTPDYQVGARSGQRGAGDSSSNIHAGTIIARQRSLIPATDFHVDVRKAYEITREIALRESAVAFSG